MKTIILFFLGLTSILLAQGELDIKPSNIDFKDEFHRIESVKLFNKGEEILLIDSIKFKQNLFFITFDKPVNFPIQINPKDSIKMDITLTNYFTVTSADTADLIEFLTSNPEKDEELRVRIRFFDDDEKYGILKGQIQNDSLSVENTKIFLFRDGQYLFDSVNTDLNGNFTINLPEGFYTAAAEKKGFYFTYFKNQFDLYNANQFFIEHETETNINWQIEKIIETNNSLSGKVLNFKTAAPTRKGIIIVRKGKHTPTKNLNKLFNENSEIISYSTKILPDGSYNFDKIIEPGYYFIQAFPDFYTPSYVNDENLPAIFWQDADSVFINNGILNKDIFVLRDSAYGAGNLSGQITINSNPAINNNFIVFAKNIVNNTFTNYSISDSLGKFNIINLPYGNYKLQAYEFGNFDFDSEEIFTIDLLNSSVSNIQINFLINSINSKTNIPNAPILFPNYPNPFNPITKIQFFLPEEDNIYLSILNILGEKVAVIYKGKLKTGLHDFSFDGKNLSSGIYFIKFETSYNTQINKAILLK